MNAIAYAWQYAELASHAPESDSDRPLLKNSIFTPLENDEDYGYIAEFSDKIIIAFQGSKNLKAWISDFTAFPMRWDDKLKDTRNGQPGTIHNGFYEGWSNFKEPIEDYLLTYSGSTKSACADTWKKNSLLPLYVYGHSRGGALGALCARHIAKNLGVPCSCIIFGSPAQGNSQYRDQFNLLPINCTDVTHGYEFTRDLPPEAAGFRRAGRPLWLPEPIIHKYFYKIRDHFYSTTTKALIAYSKGDSEALAALDVISDNVTV
jgi:hypothetical protein